MSTLVKAIAAYIALSLSFEAVGFENTIILNSAAEAPLSNNTKSDFISEVTREAFRRIGYRLLIQYFPPGRGLKNSNSGLIDGELIRIKGLEKHYPNLLHVPEKIISLDFVVFSKQKMNLKNGWSDLSDKTVAHINGWKHLEKNIPSSANITKVGNAKILFKLLDKNRIDCVVYELWSGNRAVLQQSIENVIVNRTPLAVNKYVLT